MTKKHTQSPMVSEPVISVEERASPRPSGRASHGKQQEGSWLRLPGAKPGIDLEGAQSHRLCPQLPDLANGWLNLLIFFMRQP